MLWFHKKTSRKTQHWTPKRHSAYGKRLTEAIERRSQNCQARLQMERRLVEASA